MATNHTHPSVPPMRKIAAPFMLLIGALMLIGASFYESYIMGAIGLVLTFWGALLLYIAVKYVPSELLNATTLSALQNTERILANYKEAAKGIYLSPKYLHNYNTSLVFVPLKGQTCIPKPEEIDENSLHTIGHSGLLFTPPGFDLTKIIERNINKSFTKMTLDELLENLPTLLIENSDIADKIEVSKEGNTITIIATNHAFKQLCTEMSALPITHHILGCAFTSTIACALAKSSGKPVTINKEEQGKGNTTIEYIIKDD